MSQVHTVKQGECLARIVKEYGFRDWQKIFDHPKNKEFKEKRSSPNILMPGDKIFIPDKEVKEEDISAGKKYKIKIKTKPIKLRLELRDNTSKPLRNKKYSLRFQRATLEGKTNDNGLLEQEIQPDDEEGELIIWLDNDASDKSMIFKINVGHLDPIEEISGIQGRLNNLGYKCGEPNGELDERTREALKVFQLSVGIEPTGEIDDDTRLLLREQYKC